MNYYARYPGDYQADTAHLSLAEHGAYSILLDTCYATERGLPADYPTLCRICRATTPAEQKAVRSVADQFFPIAEDGLRHNARADREIAKAARRIETARGNGQGGGRPPKEPTENPPGNPVGLRNGTQTKPSGEPALVSPTPTPEEEEGENPLPTPGGVGVAETAGAASGDPPSEGRMNGSGGHDSILPRCPIQRIVEVYHEVLSELPQCLVVNEGREKLIRSRWREFAKSKHWRSQEEGVEFFRGYFRFVGQSKFLTGRAPPQRDREPFTADLEWLMRPSNFAKVVEGKYH